MLNPGYADGSFESGLSDDLKTEPKEVREQIKTNSAETTEITAETKRHQCPV